MRVIIDLPTREAHRLALRLSRELRTEVEVHGDAGQVGAYRMHQYDDRQEVSQSPRIAPPLALGHLLAPTPTDDVRRPQIAESETQRECWHCGAQT